jgi:DNA-binding response OmpR family regulator
MPAGSPSSRLNATAARQTLEANPDIQVVLLDWMLPDGSGVDLCRESRRSRARRST